MSHSKQRAKAGALYASKKKKKNPLPKTRVARSWAEDRSLYNTNMLKPRAPLLAAELIEPIVIITTVGGSTGGAVTFVDNAIKINSLADAAWGSVPGLTMFNDLYSSYRVIGVQMELSCGSKHSANVNAAYLFTDTSSAVTTSGAVLMAAGNQYGGLKLLSAVTAGEPIKILRRKVWLADVIGSDSVLTDDDYAAATNAVADPASLIYLHLMSATQSGNFAANGDCAFTLKVALLTKFFNRVRQIN